MLACDCLVQDFVPEPSSWWVPSCNMGRGVYRLTLLKNRTARHKDLQFYLPSLVHRGAVMLVVTEPLGTEVGPSRCLCTLVGCRVMMPT